MLNVLLETAVRFVIALCKNFQKCNLKIGFSSSFEVDKKNSLKNTH